MPVQLDLFGMPVGSAPSVKPARQAGSNASGERHRLTARNHAKASRRPARHCCRKRDCGRLQCSAAAATPKKRRTRDVLAAEPSAEVLEIARALPPQIHLGTSTWSFPGWKGIVYGDDYSNSKLSRDGLTAYGAHPLLRTVSIDRSFYAPLTVTDYLRYAQQVPDHFRFIVKAPPLVTDATVRAERGEPVSLNPCFLNAQLATDEFVQPCLDGLGTKAGALVFQFSPLPDQMLARPGWLHRAPC